MPEYVYLDRNGHTWDLIRPMIDHEDVICEICGSVMWRKPQIFTVTWGGLAPSQGELNPEIKEHIEAAPENQAIVQKEKESYKDDQD